MTGSVRFKKLFEPVLIGAMEVRNRIVMPAMGTNFASEDGHVTEQLKDYHEERAKGGVGLIVVESACVDAPAGRGIVHQLRVDDDSFIPGLSELAHVIKRHGAKVAPQLHHAGGSAKSSITGVQPVAPSAIARPGWELPRELTVSEIKDLVARYAEAADRAKKAGFDAVEILAGHRYLIAQFLSLAWNKRSDAYGGDLEGRARFLLEIVAAVRQSIGPEFPLWCRINAAELGIKGGTTIGEGQALARMLQDSGVDAINVSASSIQSVIASAWVVEGKRLPPAAHPPGFLIPLAESIKRAVNIPVIAVGYITPEVGEKILQEEKADLVAIGRGLLADPELPNKVALGRLEDVTPCIRCLVCRDRVVEKDIAIGCSVNAALGREREYAIRPAQKTKRIMVVGGGPAGMEVARVGALRGHQVLLYEKANNLGGQLNLAAVPPYKSIIGSFSDYIQTQIRKLGVKVELRKEVTPSLVKKSKPDVIILATGMTAVIPEIAGIARQNVVTAEDVLTGKAQIGKRIVVIGGGMVGCETAEFLAERDKKVTVVEMLENLAVKMGAAVRQLLIDRLDAKGVIMLTGVKCEEVTDRGLVIVHKGVRRQTIEADTIVLAGGSLPNQKLFKALEGKVPEIYLAGDCEEPRTIIEAVADGSRLAHLYL